MKATIYHVTNVDRDDKRTTRVSMCTNGRHVFYDVRSVVMAEIPVYVHILPKTVSAEPCRGACRNQSYDIREDVRGYRQSVGNTTQEAWEEFVAEQGSRLVPPDLTRGRLYFSRWDDRGCGGHSVCLGPVHIHFSNEGSSGCGYRDISIEMCDHTCEKRRVEVPNEIEKYCVGKIPQQSQSKYAW